MGEAGKNSRERIMEATYRALIETGYADLTMNDIAEESETSTALLHYHFDTKEDLLVAFLDHLLENMERDLDELAGADPIDRLDQVIDWFVLGAEEADREAFHVALLELRGQAPYNERYRKRMREADRLLRESLAEIVRDGIEKGVFASVDPEALSTLLIAAMDGARVRQIANREPGYSGDVREALSRYVLDHLLTDEATMRWEALADGEGEDE